MDFVNTMYDGYLKNYSKSGELINLKYLEKQTEFRDVSKQINNVNLANKSESKLSDII